VTVAFVLEREVSSACWFLLLSEEDAMVMIFRWVHSRPRGELVGAEIQQITQ
jgi:hypothetical protein